MDEILERLPYAEGLEMPDIDDLRLEGDSEKTDEDEEEDKDNGDEVMAEYRRERMKDEEMR